MSGADVALDKRSISNWLWSPSFDSLMHGLDNVRPMEKPNHIRIEPHPRQSKAAAQIHHACLGPFAGMILADPKCAGMGRRTTAVLAIHLAKELPGKTLIIVPERRVFHSDPPAHHWLQKFEKIWEQGYGPKVLHPEDPNISATDLVASDWDVIICQYDFVQASYQKLQSTGVAPLHGNEITWKTVYLDDSNLAASTEANTASAQYIAIENLTRRATVCITANPIFDLWDELFDAINLLRGHPWINKASFTHTFGNAGTTFNPIRLTPECERMLQKFLQAVFVARPSSRR